MTTSTSRSQRCVAQRCAASLVLAACAMLAACAGPTSLQGHWRSPDASAYRLGKVLAIAAVDDSTSRRLVEDNMVAALASKGVEAQPSYRWLPQAGPSSEPELGKAVAAAGADSVLLVSPGKVSSETVVTPGTMIGPPPMVGMGGFYGYYRGVYAPVYIPPTAYTVRSISSEARLFDAASKTLKWVGAARTELSGAGLDELTRQYAGVIVEALVADGLIR
jgi:hypothetical protein